MYAITLHAQSWASNIVPSISAYYIHIEYPALINQHYTAIITLLFASFIHLQFPVIFHLMYIVIVYLNISIFQYRDSLLTTFTWNNCSLLDVRKYRSYSVLN